MTVAAENKLAFPNQWTQVRIPELDARLYDNSRVYAPAHDLEVAQRYPTYEDGRLVADVTQVQMTEFLKEHNASNKTDFRTLMLFEDESVRAQLGSGHALFDENFERNRQPYRWGYVADFTRSYGQAQEGVNGQDLVTRIAYWRLPEGDVELGIVTIAPVGMVPALTRKQLEKMIHKEGLHRLGKLRGEEIYEKENEIVDVKNALGYPQFTLDHNQRDENGIIPHSSHVYRPRQDYGETTAVRSADWSHRGGQRCFGVRLRVGSAYSLPDGSFPLVRGGKFKAKISRPSKEVEIP